MYKILFLSTLLFCSFWSTAQTTTVGFPKSLKGKLSIPSSSMQTMPAFNVEKCKQEDAINEANKVGPWRFGYEHNVTFNLQNNGIWHTFPNGDRIWLLEIESIGALSLNLVFDQFQLPKGATLQLYNPKTAAYTEAYTNLNNNPHNLLGTTLVQGENLVVEYFEPKNVAGQGQLQIGTVVHGYKPLTGYTNTRGLNDGGDCNYDVKCPLGLGWENQINSTAMIVNGGGICTGALINNTLMDGTPYFLTANHCLGNPGTWLYRFNWDSPTAICAAVGNSVDPGTPYNEVNGGTLRANNGGSDFALIELNAIPTGDIYYAGWDKTGAVPTEVTGIHHPRGDVKKICRDNNPAVSTTWQSSQVWEITDWDLGVTEPASSGSPLFDQNFRIIGQLYGGTAACNGTTDNNQDDNYGRLSTSWDGASASVRLKDWLDPNNSQLTTIDGLNPNAPTVSVDAGLTGINNIDDRYCNVSSFVPNISLRNFGQDTLMTATILYNIDGGTNSTYNWTGSLPSGNTETIVLPAVAGIVGIHTFNVSATNPNGVVDSNLVNNAQSFNFEMLSGAQQAALMLSFDCYASETSWAIKDTNGNIVYTANGYSSSTSPDTASEVFCLAAGCYDFVIYDSFGDGLDGGNNCNHNGDYRITDLSGNPLVMMSAPDGDFGDSTVHNFCIAPPVMNDAGLLPISGIDSSYCNSNSFTPQLTLRNFGTNALTSVDIYYNLDGGSNTVYNWTGNLNPASSTMVNLPTQTANNGGHTFNVYTDNPNNSVDSNNINNTQSFDFYVILNGQTIDLMVQPDCSAGEVSWAIKDSASGFVIYEGGDYSTNATPPADNKALCLGTGCYQFVIYDSYGDGLNTGSWWCNQKVGDYEIRDQNGMVLVDMTTASYGDSAVHNFCVQPIFTTIENADNTISTLNIYPNPTQNKFFVDLTLNEKQTVQVELLNATGQRLQTQVYQAVAQQKLAMNIENYPSGLYFIKLTVGDQTLSKKVLKR